MKKTSIFKIFKSTKTYKDAGDFFKNAPQKDVHRIIRKAAELSNKDQLDLVKSGLSTTAPCKS